MLTTYPNQPSPSCKNVDNKRQHIFEKKKKRKKQRSTHCIPDPEEMKRIQRIERTLKYVKAPTGIQNNIYFIKEEKSANLKKKQSAESSQKLNI